MGGVEEARRYQQVHAASLAELLDAAKQQVQTLLTEKQSVEKSLKKLAYDSNEKKESLERQISKLTEEVNFLRTSNREQRVDGAASVELELKESLKHLEAKFKEVRDKFGAKSKAFDELEFEYQQMKNTIANLKVEVQQLSDANGSERKERHKAEMSLFEVKTKLADASVNNRQAEERCRQALSELDSTRADLARLDEASKNDKRRVLNLEREFEEFKYTATTRSAKDAENIGNLTKQIAVQKQENEHLSARLASVAHEAQTKSAKDQKDLISLQHKVRLLESRESDMTMCIDDLQKKLSFYKDQVNNRQTEQKLRNFFAEKLLLVLHLVQQVREKTDREILMVKQDLGNLNSSILRQTELYYQSVRPRYVNAARSFAAKPRPPAQAELQSPLNQAKGAPQNNFEDTRTSYSVPQNQRAAPQVSPMSSRYEAPRFPEQYADTDLFPPGSAWRDEAPPEVNPFSQSGQLKHSFSFPSPAHSGAPPLAHFTLGQHADLQGQHQFSSHQARAAHFLAPPAPQGLSGFIPKHLKKLMSSDPLYSEASPNSQAQKNDPVLASVQKLADLHVQQAAGKPSPGSGYFGQNSVGSSAGSLQLSSNQSAGGLGPSSFLQKQGYSAYTAKQTPKSSAMKEQNPRTPLSELQLNKLDLSPLQYSKADPLYDAGTAATVKDRPASHIFSGQNPLVQPYALDVDSFKLGGQPPKRPQSLEQSLGLNLNKREKLDIQKIERESEEIVRRIEALKSKDPRSY